jgi:hypothetical protein
MPETPCTDPSSTTGKFAGKAKRVLGMPCSSSLDQNGRPSRIKLTEPEPRGTLQLPSEIDDEELVDRVVER